MNAPLLQGFATVASAIAATVLNALWEDTLLSLGVWLLLRAWPQLNASTRYTVWCATLAAAVLVPVATTLPYFASQRTPVAAASAVTGATQPNARVHDGAAAARHAVPSAAPAAALYVPQRFHVTLALPLALSIFAAWAVLALLALVRLAVGLSRLEALKRDALPLPVEYRDAMARWGAAGKGSRDVRLCVSDETDVPVAVGLFDAMILIPRVLLERLSESEVDQISLHELAHLRRADDWTNGLQRVLVGLLGWNPAALFIAQQMDLEREVACDDYVLSLVDSVRPYALCLTKMAETSSWPRVPIAAPGVFATRKHISLRIERLLGAGRNVATNLAIGPAAVAVAIVGGLALAMGLVAPSFAADISQAIAPASATPAAPAAAATPAKRIIIVRQMVPSAVEIPAVHVSVPPQTIRVPGVKVDLPARTIPFAIPSIDTAAIEAQVRQTVAQAQAQTRQTVAQARQVAQNASSCNNCDLEGVNWAGRDLRGKTYSGADFSGANLDGANFSGDSFSGVDFSHANLKGAIFSNASLSGCDFSRANLVGATFAGAQLSGCDFARAGLDNVNFNGTMLNECDLSGVDMSRVDLSKAIMHNVNLGHRRGTPEPPETP